MRTSTKFDTVWPDGLNKKAPNTFQKIWTQSKNTKKGEKTTDLNKFEDS